MSQTVLDHKYSRCKRHLIMLPIAFFVTARAVSWFGNNDDRTFETSRGIMQTKHYRALSPRVECSVTTVLIARNLLVQVRTQYRISYPNDVDNI